MRPGVELSQQNFPSTVHIFATNLSLFSCRARYAMPLRIFVRSLFILIEWYFGSSFKFFLHLSMRVFTFESLRRTISWRSGKARLCSPTLTAGFPIICDRTISDSLRSGSIGFTRSVTSLVVLAVVYSWPPSGIPLMCISSRLSYCYRASRSSRNFSFSELNLQALVAFNVLSGILKTMGFGSL